jgi:hypothetical protein
MVAVTSAGSRIERSTSNVTRARCPSTMDMSLTWPTRTPDTRTSSPGLSEVTSVKRAE